MIHNLVTIHFKFWNVIFFFLHIDLAISISSNYSVKKEYLLEIARMAKLLLLLFVL